LGGELNSMVIFIAPVVAAAIGLVLAVRPEAVARYFQSQWKNDSLAFNRRLSDPAKLATQSKTFRLVGLLGLVIALVMGILIWAARI
jgi:hypothetical protein